MNSEEIHGFFYERIPTSFSERSHGDISESMKCLRQENLDELWEKPLKAFQKGTLEKFKKHSRNVFQKQTLETCLKINVQDFLQANLNERIGLEQDKMQSFKREFKTISKMPISMIQKLFFFFILNHLSLT